MPNPPARRETPLSRGEIARVALGMVDADGVEPFSMRRLADALGVTTMAVYHHFRGKAEVLQAAADQVWIEVALAVVPHDDPVEDLVQSMLTTRRTFQAHPEIAPFAFASPTTAEAVHLGAVAIVQVFERAGFRGRDAAAAYQALATYTLGSALISAERTILDRAIRGPVSDLADLADGGLEVELAGDSLEAYDAVRDAMAGDPDLVRFEQGLRDITAGLVARYVT